MSHITVLQTEAVDSLVQCKEGLYIDGTFGRGGHSRAILERLSPQGRLIGFDRDLEAFAVGKALEALEPRFEMIHENFSSLAKVIEKKALVGKVQGILLDIGVSSPQLDDASRGFSFMQSGPLDMRMDTTKGQSAREWLKTVSASELAYVLKEYGEERFAKRIANAIVTAREIKPIMETGELAAIVKAAHPRWEKHKHPATRVFQAIRIFINDELNELKHALESALGVLGKQGRLVVISFHSLEDRMVKRFLRQHSHSSLPKETPLMGEDLTVSLRVIGKAVKPTDQEIDLNPRARSAVMRVGEKIR